MIKSISNEHQCFVVFHCDNNWDNIANYTGQLTPTNQLIAGWIDNTEEISENISQLQQRLAELEDRYKNTRDKPHSYYNCKEIILRDIEALPKPEDDGFPF